MGAAARTAGQRKGSLHRSGGPVGRVTPAGRRRRDAMHRKMRAATWLRAAAVLAVFALVLAACGNDNGGGDESPGATSAGETSPAGENFVWYMVTDQAGLGDKGFNDLTYAGVQQAADELGGEAKVIESTEQAQYVPNLEQAVANGASMTVGVGFLIADAMHEVASAHPDSKFVLIDAVSADNNGTPDDFTDDKPDTNVQSVLFKENEGAYLAGIIAGMTSQSHHYGFVGGIEIPPVEIGR